MTPGISPVNADLRLAQLLGEDQIAQMPEMPAAPTAAAPAPAQGANFTGNPFEDVLSKAVEALNGVSRLENHANELVTKYTKGETDLQTVMVEQAKMSVMVTMAVTTVNAASTTLKEITQMQI
ncbi:MAG: flagellar hook-basal body complex protein FliE [bacterium]